MWLNDLRIVLPDGVLEHGSVRLEEGVIADIVEGSSPNQETRANESRVHHLSGMTLIPGLIDLHGDMLERDVEPRPSARFPTELALYELDKRYAGTGITTAFVAISFAWRAGDLRSQESATEMIETIARVSAAMLVDLRVHARFEVTNPETGPILTDLLDRKLVHLVSIMDHTPGQGQYKDVDRYIDFMQKWLGADLDMLGEHKQRMIDKMRENIEAAAVRTRDWAVVRDVLATSLAHGVPVASHDDDTIVKVQQQAEMGVTISEFPVSVAAANAARDHGMAVIMGAPNAYRGSSTSANLSAMDAIRAGLVDILATDYYPAAILHTVFKLAREGVMPLHESVKLGSTNAADAMGMNDRGRIAVGQKADLVVVDTNDGAGQESIYPRVRGVIRGGAPIYWDSHLASLSQVVRL